MKNLKDVLKANCYSWGIFCYFISFVGSFFSLGLAFRGNLRLSRGVFFVFIQLSVLAIILLALSGKKIGNRISIQMFLVYLWLNITYFVFFFSIILNDRILYCNAVFYAIPLVFGFLFWQTKINNKKDIAKKIPVWIWRNKYYVILFTIFIILCLEMFNKGIKWDSRVYYQSLVDLSDFTLSPSDINLFKVSEHLSLAYALIYGVGEVLSPGTAVGIRLISVILLLVVTVLFALIIKKIVKNSNPLVVFLSSAAFLFVPVIWGPIHEINPEILLLVSFIGVLFCCYYNYYILGVLFGIFLVFSKETGAVLLGGVIVGLLIQKIIERRLFCLDSLKKILCLFIPEVFFLYMYAMDKTGWAGKTTIETGADGDLINVWKMNMTIIINKMKQMFVMNFNWVILLLIVVLFVVALVKKRIHFDVKVMPLLVSFVLLFFLQTMYITYMFPRYIILVYFFEYLLLVYLVCSLNNKILGAVLIGIMIVLNIVSTYYTVDIVTLKMFYNVNIGNTVVASDAEVISYDKVYLTTGEKAHVIALSPYAYYNRQFAYYDELINVVFEKIQYNSNILIVYPDLFHPFSYGPYLGYHYDNYYDKETKRIVQKYSTTPITDNMEYINCILAGENEEIRHFEEYSEVYYLKFPFRDDFNHDSIINQYDIIETFEVSYRGWKVEVFKLK